jgi:hypothetical protein
MSCSKASVKLKTDKVKRMVTGDINAPTIAITMKDKSDKKKYIDLASNRLAEEGKSCKVIGKKAKDIKNQSYEQTTQELAFELMRKNPKYKDMTDEQLKKISDSDTQSPLNKSVAFNTTVTKKPTNTTRKKKKGPKCNSTRKNKMINSHHSKINRKFTEPEIKKLNIIKFNFFI